jgi:Glyoxalase/Bleomycin resistance protein/Dioxygenase superfamily
MMSIPVGSVTETCYVTYNLDKAMAEWTRATGAGPWFEAEFPASLVKSYRGKPAADSFRAAIAFAGTSLIELVQPTNDAPSIFREILETRGEGGLHHVYPRIRPRKGAEYDRACADYRALGLEPALSFTIEGMGRNDFFDATATLGCFIELLEFEEAVYDAIMRPIYQAHIEWDGKTRPVRSMNNPSG